MNKKPSKKLDYIKIGLFSIKKSKGLINYKLNLLADAKVYLIFYIFRLKLVDSKIPLQDTFYFQIKEETEFEVEEILG